MNNYFRQYINILFALLLAGSVTACGGNSETQNETADNETTTSTQSEMAYESDAKLNINTALDESFNTIPKVGETMVHEFKEYRPYVSIRQFRQEIGKYVDEERVATYERYIYVPIHRNDSDAATLQQIPGLDASDAEELIAGRPYDSNQAFMEELSSYVNEDQMAIANTYMEN